ncbi:hypothetical protein D3C86_2258750 [compost metagenome]
MIEGDELYTTGSEETLRGRKYAENLMSMVNEPHIIKAMSESRSIDDLIEYMIRGILYE